MTRFWVLAAGLPLLAASAYSGTYIVKLSADAAAAASATGKVRASAAVVPPARTQRAAVMLQQNQARAAIAEQTSAEVLDCIDTVGNALIVRIPDDQAAALRNIPGVVRVYPEKQYKLLLNRALPLVHAKDAWQLVGGSDFAGKGVKIGIIDTGVDQSHPAFEDTELTVPDGFPKGNKPGDLAFTNSKVIVARSYENLGAATPADPVDIQGHGTAVAGTAAAAFTVSPVAGLISGLAPKAWIGNYKVFSGLTASNAAIAKAIDDAVKDGMDVINMSLGSPLAARTADEPLAENVANAAAAGVVVVVAAGNDGPEPATLSGLAGLPEVVAVGATVNDRQLAATVVLSGAPPYASTPAPAFSGRETIAGPLRDVSTLDQSGQACSPFPAASLTGRIALILRGSCTFEIKLNNAAAAGAAAAVVYTTPEQAVALMETGSATIPAVMVSNAAGIDMKSRLAQNPDAVANVQFRAEQVIAADPNTLAPFSSLGPSAEVAIKPDLLAVGRFVYMPALFSVPNLALAEVVDPSGFTSASGTSFSSPMVAGATAVVKAARPGLSARQYRSLLVNSANSFVPTTGPAGVQTTGAGILNVANAIQVPVAAFPDSLSFGAGPGTASMTQQLTLTNVGMKANTFSISVEPKGGGPAPVVTPNTVQLERGASRDVQVQFSPSGLQSGEYQGVLIVHGANSVDARIAYWYAVPSGVPERVTVLASDDSDPVGRITAEAITFRVTDSTGVSVPGIQPVVTAVEGTGVATVVDADGSYPGVWFVNVKPSSGANTFRIQVGNISKDVTILGQ